ncbi:heterogeneous nuclear ribonucleoprotein 1 [Cornus florida]|uniref:heterogeneous nuclear ribonucleoprotein 1 n=1 Tax=Cornus florida TaxID=4283 RepID=UPI0028A2BD3B|nr:heterogeneous nuclear ribonucleoprotein 1 [Cornus florida]XP_059666500.1 heterogeneous nuclear ribonucleoprotein 1 [Cornus florida]
MEPDLSKLFIGGISWETDENSLREYFSAYGEVVEAVIMRDRVKGRARGFGFIVFADPGVAERVAMVKHMIDGRTVEAKKAVPRDDQHMLDRNNHSIQGSPGPGHKIKKIFVGGLASTVTEGDFKKYFDQFGTVTDVVVMYDHNTQRPRGFGFITYDSEEAVDRVLHNTFHELNGKTVEVKWAVPKELSPGPSRSPLVGYNYGFSKAKSLRNNYAQGYNLSSAGGFGVGMDGKFNLVASGHFGFSSFGSGYGMGVNLDPGLSQSFGGSSKFSNNLGYGRDFSHYGGNSNRYSAPIGYGRSSGRFNSLLSSSQNVWGNIGLHGGTNVSSPGSRMGSVSGSFGISGNSKENWGSPPISAQAGRTAFSLTSGTVRYGGGENGFGLGEGGFGRIGGIGVSPTSSLSASSGGGSYGDLYRGGSVYGDSTWWSTSSELEGHGLFGYGLSNAADVSAKGSEGYVGGYSIANRLSNEGIAT